MSITPGALAYLFDVLERPCGPVCILSATRLPDRDGNHWYGVQAAVAGAPLYTYDARGRLVARGEPVLMVTGSELREMDRVSEEDKQRFRVARRRSRG